MNRKKLLLVFENIEMAVYGSWSRLLCTVLEVETRKNDLKLQKTTLGQVSSSQQSECLSLKMPVLMLANYRVA